MCWARRAPCSATAGLPGRWNCSISCANAGPITNRPNAGAEPRVRYALALRKLGRETEARETLRDVVRQLELAPRYVRKAQAEWLAIARQSLKV